MSHDVVPPPAALAPAPVESPRFDYFLVQTHVAPQGEATLVRLTVEDLSSGEKRVFESIRELSHFLKQLVERHGDARWAPPPTEPSDGETPPDADTPRGNHE